MPNDEVRDMHGAWSTERVTEAERLVFRNAFYDCGHSQDVGEHTMRASTLEVFRRVLAQSAEPCSVEDVRRVLSSWHYADGSRFEPGSDIHDRALLRPAFQARQLQRMSLEAVLCWVENFIGAAGGSASTEDMANAADAAARAQEDAADAHSVSAYLEAVASRAGEEDWPAACAWNASTDIFDLMDSPTGAVWREDWDRVPGLALRGIALA